MALFGWMALLGLTLCATFVSFVLLIVVPKFNGKIDLENLIIPAITAVLWYFIYNNIPFPMAMI